MLKYGRCEGESGKIIEGRDSSKVFHSLDCICIKVWENGKYFIAQVNLGNCRWGKQIIGSGMSLLCLWANKQTGLRRIKDDIRSLGRVTALGRSKAEMFQRGSWVISHKRFWIHNYWSSVSHTPYVKPQDYL